MTWFNAQEHCQKIGMQMATLDTTSLVEEVAQELKNRGFSKNSEIMNEPVLKFNFSVTRCGRKLFLVVCIRHRPSGGTIPVVGREGGGQCAVGKLTTWRIRWRKTELRVASPWKRHIAWRSLLNQYYLHFMRIECGSRLYLYSMSPLRKYVSSIYDMKIKMV